LVAAKFALMVEEEESTKAAQTVDSLDSVEAAELQSALAFHASSSMEKGWLEWVWVWRVL
jgi:hypothetical protein